jgi:hypothetical protein
MPASLRGMVIDVHVVPREIFICGRFIRGFFADYSWISLSHLCTLDLIYIFSSYIYIYIYI